jgi:hypothetical protein
VRRQAIGGDNVEPRAGQEHNTCFLRLSTHSRQRFKADDFAADIHIVPPGTQAGFCHPAERMDEWTGAVEHRIHFQ